jgi:hypothetical protein
VDLLFHGNARNATILVGPKQVLLRHIGSLIPHHPEVGIRLETNLVQDSDQSESLLTTQYYDCLPIVQVHDLPDIG